MRVLHIVTTLDIGGAEAQILEVVRRLDRARFTPVVAWLKGVGELAPAFEEAGIRTVNLRLGERPGPESLRETIRCFRELKPHVVHTHLGKADVVGGIAARFTGVPVVVSTKHNEDAYLRFPPVGLAGRAVAQLADEIVVISGAVGRFLKRKMFLPERRMRLIRYGYPPNGAAGGTDEAISRELKAEFGLAEDAKVVSCIARLTKQKGLYDLLRAMSLLRDAAPEARLLIVGRGELGLKLAEHVKLLGLEPTVRFTGFRRDISRILRGSDLMVLPSHWEGFGMVLLEAMEAGIPVVGTRVGAIPEVVAAGETGIIVPPKDPDALATGMVRMLRHPEEAAAMGLAGQRRLADVFGIDEAVARHEELYAELIARRARR